MPQVSIIIPTYKRPDILKRAIQSALDQTYQDYEILVIDDYSPDNTQEVVSDFKDNRIKYIRLDKNSGGSLIPRQEGIKHALGKYIAVLDDDDFWCAKDKLALQITYLELHPKCVMVGSDAVATSIDGTQIALHHFPKSNNEIKKLMLLQNWFYHASVVHTKSALEKVGGYPAINGGHYHNMINEYELWLKMGMIGELTNLDIIGVGYTYADRKIPFKTKIDWMLRHFRTISKYKKYYPNYLKAIVFNIILTLFELPILINIKRYMRGY